MERLTMSAFILNSEELAYASNGQWLNLTDKIYFSTMYTDSRKTESNALFFALQGESFDGHDFLDAAIANGAAALCINKSKLGDRQIPLPVLLVEDTLKAYQDIAKYYLESFRKNLKVIAVTGSSGKTSSKEMLRSVFAGIYGTENVLATEGNTNNHIGVPQNIFKLRAHHKACILEMGTNHFGEIEVLSRIAQPDTAIICSIGRCHLEHFGDVNGVAKEKSTIFSHMRKDGTAIIPVTGNGHAIMLEAASKFNFIQFGTSENADVQAEYLGGNLNGSSFNLHFKKTGQKVQVNWKLAGAHQASNAAAAAAAAMLYGASPELIAKSLENSSLPGMRARVTVRNGVTWLNDAYNANPDSMKASLEWLKEFADEKKTVIVAGDMRELGDSAAQAHYDTLVYARKLFPSARIFAVGPEMCNAYAKLTATEKNNLSVYPDSQSAITPVRSAAQNGDLIFLKASRGTKLEVIEAQ